MTKKTVLTLCWGLSLSFMLLPRLYAQDIFLYANNAGSSVSGFSFGANRVLIQIPGSPFLTGGGFGTFGNGIATSLRPFLYASNGLGQRVNAFLIDAITGVLTPIAGSPFDTGTGQEKPVLIAITPNEQFLFAYNASGGKIATFRIAPDGSLIRLPQITSTFFTFGKGIKVSPDGKFLFVNQGITGIGVAVFGIGSDGSLTPISSTHITPASDCDNGTLDVNCAGNLLFVASNCNDLFVFNIAENGMLTMVQGSPFILAPARLGLSGLLVNSAANLLFVSNVGTRQISVFGVSPAGVISSVPISSINITNPRDEDTRPVDIVLNMEESLLYVASADGTIFVFDVDPGGFLTPVPGSPFRASSASGTSLAVYPGRSCGPVFDVCTQDDSNGNVIKLNSSTGEYQVTDCMGTVASGKGTLTKRGCLITLEHNAADRRLLARIDTCQNRATASVQLLSQGKILTIIDRNTLNNTCACR